MYPTKHLLIVLIFATITITTKVFSQSIDTTSKSPQRDHQNANDPTDDVLERFLQLIEDENDYHRLKSQEAAKNPCDKLRIEDRSFVNIHQISCTTFYRCVQDISSIEKYSSLWYECDSGLQINKNAQKCEPAEKIKCKEEQVKKETNDDDNSNNSNNNGSNKTTTSSATLLISPLYYSLFSPSYRFSMLIIFGSVIFLIV